VNAILAGTGLDAESSTMPLFERRKGDRRSSGAAPDSERRQKDRRQWPPGVLYRTAFPVSRIEDWLEEHVGGHWTIAQESEGEGFTSKILKISFELEADREAFVAHFGHQ